MVSPDDVVAIYQQLSKNGIRVWLTGGWGIDALLGQHTRPHKDLDVIMLVDDVVKMRELLGQYGYELRELWSENLWTLDTQGTRVATAFVLRDAEGHELDAHAMRLDEHRVGYPAWEKREGLIFTPPDLAGKGIVAGAQVECVSAENQMICHTGYQLPDYQWRDLDQLQEMYKVEFPVELASQRTTQGSGSD